LPTKGHFADVKEAAKNNWYEGMLIVEEWLLIEYAVGTIPVNPETVVEVVSKTIPEAHREHRHRRGRPGNDRADAGKSVISYSFSSANC
jgi:hypothetical protein